MIVRPPMTHLAALLLLVALLGCGRDDKGTAGSDGGRAEAVTLTVSAAASLTESFTEIGKDFERANGGVTVMFSFDSSGTLADQIVEGAPADVFASADESPMDKVVEADLVEGDPAPFARNKLTIVVKSGNPEGVASVADLVDLGTVAICEETAPCGALSKQVLADEGVDIPADKITRGQNVRATLAAVTEGDADAAIVYVSDSMAAGDNVDTVEIPGADKALATYRIAVLSVSGDKGAAQDFVTYVLSDDARAVLKKAGFLSP